MDLIGQQFGSYVAVKKLGAGGMGTVYRGMDHQLGREVAPKAHALHADAGVTERLSREARVLAQLEHPGIVPVHEAGRWANGDPYYVMKLVSGRTLKEVMAEARTLGERLALLPHLIAVAEAVGLPVIASVAGAGRIGAETGAVEIVAHTVRPGKSTPMCISLPSGWRTGSIGISSKSLSP